MRTYCERQGQLELGIIEKSGRQIVATGSSVQGNRITGYTHLSDVSISLVRWDGQTMLECRSEVIERHRDGSIALMFRLPKRRFIVGYALGEDGMLFRGELLHGSADEDSRSIASAMADYFIGLDAEDIQNN